MKNLLPVFLALAAARAFGEPNLSNLDTEVVVKKPPVTRGLNTQPTRTAVTRSYDPKRGLVTIEEVDGTVRELPYVVLPIHFKFDSDELLDNESQDNVRKTADKLKEPQLRGARFVVEGHTSTEGRSKHNQELSERRARRIYDLLVGQLGIEPARLAAKGFGLSAPEVQPETTEQDRQRNRRVLIVKEANSSP